jgi:hypothetical protein
LQEHLKHIDEGRVFLRGTIPPSDRVVSEAVRDHRPCLQGLCSQGFTKAAIGLIGAYRGIAFGHVDSCDERKGVGRRR